MTVSSLVVGIIGIRYAMSQEPFWEPSKFIPVMGMLLGNSMNGVAIGLGSTLRQLSEQREKIENYLAFGASRWEAARPVAMEAIRIAMLPTINDMSVIGLISIPGMMTGQIIAGAPVMNAVKYQQIIMFMITASVALSVLASVFLCVYTCIDKTHRLRTDRITEKQPWLYLKWHLLLKNLSLFSRKIGNFICACFNRQISDESRPLLRSGI
ncbi:hypothetical protein G9A89_015269 [Geosiphon pyriformis]|nr:hypothetical protein G9A89_015269 [Geosiphon pyriformis]